MADNQVSSANVDDMSVEDRKRRRFLTGITAGFGAIGGAFAITPFVLSMSPSERAKNAGAPVHFDLAKIQPGQMVKVEWRGKPVVLLKRSDEMMIGLDKITEHLADPNSLSSAQPGYAQNSARSDTANPELLVMEAVCTHLGCSPVEKLAIGPDPQMGPDSQGGFFCPCHGSKFDLAGRVYKNVPATTNMAVPPYIINGTVITIGEDGGRTA
ncbi:ubiquinol-cytochrome c reductase iron-sulfur subunit [Arenicella xantha]|uniref:Ubiquinol-cytochrome c reductase iron-sulfur subunit n=1 Tax=Arenicella xantha TaxID=644221 RepID=A0A395JSK5_9GAMM|nr:ubiquinol-cytochrome c reductase iron-sulfur subunit [Arenicella xantha]RBP53332.1 ubiquinol-cytochrome c reductase iron-sulfur subunit [Arenicella xantha]